MPHGREEKNFAIYDFAVADNRIKSNTDKYNKRLDSFECKRQGKNI
jgi:hypothetical protein